ncbi:hypothetical protein MKP08_02315 [Erythrobacter sp. LQ02-29]|uniref:hypothetical protein n=1 Tax=Erythrobacter sp. LQ02-29 TaxID=2920384 RepID=UPI001F4EA9E8|nr:hypothetical protein [Erythrobacter sp. LQ02-29]MCP9221582.1 hypothetical protein [Erythrobacter sp. LQ02-29]
MKPTAALACLAAALGLSACATSGMSRDRYDRLVGDVANPSKVIATELAFAQAARTEGQWTAFREYAGEGAVILGLGGAIAAIPWLKQQTDPAQAVSWEPYAVWSSCDGSLAVTRGTYSEPGGVQGTFDTVWHRQKDGDYRWVLDFAYPDAAEEKPEMIAAKVADCGAPAAQLVADPATTRIASDDNTLVVDYAGSASGARQVTVGFLTDGAMQSVVDDAVTTND